MVGYHDDHGRLMYAGRVGTGFDEATFAECERRLATLARPTCPFAKAPSKEANREFHWVRPQMVAQIQFAGWSADSILRHPVFAGLRDDTDPAEVVGDPQREKTSVAAPPSTEGKSAEPQKSGRAAKRPMLPSRLDLSGVKLTNPGKLLYPDVGVTKLDLVKFFVEIGDWILPHLVNRPLSLVRCPDGVTGEAFYQKHAGPEIPAVVRRTKLVGHGSDEFLFVNDLKGLVSLA